MKRIRSLVAALLAVVLLCGVLAVPAGAAINRAAFEDEVYRLINRERYFDGKSNLVRIATLNTAARKRAEELAVKYDKDTRPGGDSWKTVLKGYSYVRAESNIASGKGKPEDVVAVWKNQKNGVAKNNYLGRYEHTGFGVYEAKDGTVYVVQIFATPSPTNPDAGFSGDGTDTDKTKIIKFVGSFRDLAVDFVDLIAQFAVDLIMSDVSLKNLILDYGWLAEFVLDLF